MMITAAAVGVVVLAPVVYFLYRIYRYNFVSRYSRSYEMLLHPSENMDFRGKQLGFYYGDFSKCLHDFKFNTEGLIVTWADNDEKEPVFHPTMVAEYVILQYEYYLKTNKEEHKASFKKHADWLVKNATAVGEDGVCWYFLYDTADDKAPFGSGIAQGIAISALLRAYQFFKDEEYLRVATQAFNLMNTPIARGGFRFENEQFKLWYEEDNVCGHILNGHIFSLLGVFDLYRVTGKPYYKECFDLGVQAIRDNVPCFDLGFNTKYRFIDEHPANNSYHYIHIALFRVLYSITNDKMFLGCAERFSDYHNKAYYKMHTFFYLLRLVLIQKLMKVPATSRS